MSELVELSASQLKLSKLCMARWGAKYLAGLDDPAGAAAENGKVVHKELEDWALLGKMPTHPQALKGLPHATAPGTASIERPVSFATPSSRWRGFVDVEYEEDAYGYLAPVRAYGTHRTVIVQDWKTTSNMTYALTVDTLPDDIQYNLYLYEAFVELQAREAFGKWVYLPPSGPAKPVIVEADRNRVVDFVLGPVDTSAKQVQALYQIRPKWQELPKNHTGCFAFNKRCPHFDLCKPTKQSFSMSDAGDHPTMTDFRSSIANDFPGAAPSAPPPAPPPAPPTAPAAPAAPELSQAEIDALVRAELAKRNPAPTHAPGQVDTSFVNPPEANPTPAANPAQAAAQQGVVPPAPVQNVEDVFTSWNRDQLKAYGALLGIADMQKSRAREPSLRDTLRARCAELGMLPGSAPIGVTPAPAPEAPPAPPAVETQAPVTEAPVPPPAVPSAPGTQITQHADGKVEFKAVTSKFDGFTLVDGRLCMHDTAGPALLRLHQILEAAHAKLKVRDYGLIQYEGAARLCGAVEDLFHLGELTAQVVVFDSTTREGSVLANTLHALAAHRAG